MRAARQSAQWAAPGSAPILVGRANEMYLNVLVPSLDSSAVTCHASLFGIGMASIGIGADGQPMRSILPIV